jgi:hypothetical protein
MWTAITAVVAVVSFLAGIQALEKKQPALAVPAFILAGLLALLTLTFDPVGWLRKSLRDNNEFDAAGQPNYWVNLNRGNLIHRRDPEVRACLNTWDMIFVNGVELPTCTVFGINSDRLYPNVGFIRELGKARYKYWDKGMVWPGHELSVKRRGCYDLWAVDSRGGAMSGEAGIEYRIYDGAWSAWFPRPGEGARYFGSQLQVRSPDDLPRIIDSAGVGENYGGPMFCIR